LPEAEDGPNGPAFATGVGAAAPAAAVDGDDASDVARPLLEDTAPPSGINWLVLASIPPGKRLFIEVKIGPEAIPELVRCLERAKKSPEQTVVIAFNIETAKAAKKALPQIKVYWLANQKQDKQTKAWKPSFESLVSKTKAAGVDGLDFGNNPTFTEANVKAVHDAGLEMYVWTVDDPERAKQLAQWGVQGITTNRAAWLREQVTGAK